MAGRTATAGRHSGLWLVVLALLGAGFLGLQQAGYASLARSGVSGGRSVAAALAREGIDRLRPSADDTLRVGNSEEPYGALPGYPAFRRTTTVTVDPHTEGLRRATVRVYWNNDRCSLIVETLLVGIQ